MYSTRIIITLLIISTTLLLGAVFFLLFNVENVEAPRETTREETIVTIPPAPQEPVATDMGADVSQKSHGSERALGTDINMEFPTLEE